MDLVEREDLLGELDAVLRTARRGAGRFVFLSGAAGVGKTSVVMALAERAKQHVPILWGACDALATPRPLGPVRDMAEFVPSLGTLLSEGGDRHAILAGVLEELSRPSLMIVEDVHWADEATLDLLRFLGRRVERSKSMVVATFRADEILDRHPLRSVLGDLATAPAHLRLEVKPLSPAGVAALAAGHPLDSDHLYRMTGGNAFYVTEVLAAPGWTVPPTVADAVLARAGRLPESVREVLEVVSIEPGPTESWLLDDLGLPPGSVEQAVTAGVLVPNEGGVAYRHELARLAMGDILAGERRRLLHRDVLAILERRRPDHSARLAHHARGAGDDAGVLRWSREAGRAATTSGAHRQAADHLLDALAANDRLPTDERLPLEPMTELLNALAAELSATDRRSEALEIRQRALALATRSDDETQRIMSKVNLGYALWATGNGDTSRSIMAEAVREAEASASRRARAHAFAGAGYLAMLSREADAAVDLCTRAIVLAEELEDDRCLIRALNARGSARICPLEDLGGVDDLERCAAIAADRRIDALHNDALENLGSGLGEIRRYELAAGYLERAIEFAEERDLDSARNYGVAWLARINFERGAWDEAAALAGTTPTGAAISPITPIVGLTVLARIRARRGDPGGTGILDRVWEMAVGTNDLQRLWPVAAARAEASWLSRASPPGADEEVASVLRTAKRMAVPWAIGELAFWAWKLGLEAGDTGAAAEPYRLHIAGRYHEAAAVWAEIGCPYEEAWALADAGDEPSLRRALDILHELGGAPLAERVRQRLRRIGAASIPTGPRAATARHPAGLTHRQVEVLDHLSHGLTDREIAERLFISPKTVGHHVSAILGKLGLSNRGEAAAHAREESGESSEER